MLGYKGVGGLRVWRSRGCWGITALFTKLLDGLLPYRMGSGGCFVWWLPIDTFPFCREWLVTKELAAL